ncbi:type II secretion system F family protein [Neobacillus rhizophilus]|uniref:Type II secretion system F family protein n=1 Tax=Neobacillus rhizophilus TaxID=2833579 RepID=A0A942YTU2_9BACI|nr:type II secretion system F family protein [Neobacillus rhizophilus]MBS4213283.1 type II secretion system F family protein [Neobacillus rhizophilus]MBU8914604.1 type II secretion system F family protein [Bacillus sp. FJAT-29953]
MDTALQLILICIGVTIGFYLFLRSFTARKRLDNRMKTFLQSSQTTEESEEEKQPSIIKRFFSRIADIFKNMEFSSNTIKLLNEAGSSFKPEEFLAFRLITAAGLVLLTLLLGLPWYLWIAAFVIGFIVPKTFMKQKRKKRLAQINYQLIEVLGMMANSMRAGFSFMQAMQLVGKEVPDPLGPEFDRAFRQAGLGMPMEDIFEEMVERLPNNELEVVVRAILAQRRSGGNLAELLETMEETIRGRVRILEELRTLTAQGRMSSWIITLLPVALAAYLSLVNWEYFAPMLQHPLGWMMIFVGAAGNIIGWVFIRKIIQIEV